jgi:hypothetical protein
MKPYTLFEVIGLFVLMLALYYLLSNTLMFSLLLVFTGYTILGINMIMRNIVKGW